MDATDLKTGLEDMRKDEQTQLQSEAAILISVQSQSGRSASRDFLPATCDDRDRDAAQLLAQHFHFVRHK